MGKIEIINDTDGLISAEGLDLDVIKYFENIDLTKKVETILYVRVVKKENAPSEARLLIYGEQTELRNALIQRAMGDPLFEEMIISAAKIIVNNKIEILNENV